MSKLLVPNVFSIPATHITYGDIADMLIEFICKNCKNIKPDTSAGTTYHNTVPTHFNNTKLLQYSYIIKQSNSYAAQTNYIKIAYNLSQNQLFKTVSTSTVNSDVRKLFTQNNISVSNASKKLAKIEDILKCCLISLEFIKQNVLRVYFPLTDSYAVFYKGTNSTCLTAVANINLSNESNIETVVNRFLSYFTGCTISGSTVTKKNILYSFLYTISAGATSFDKINNDSSVEGEGEFRTGTAYEQFHVNLT